MRIGWILGWAVPEPWFAAQVFRRLPADEHVFFPAAVESVDRLTAPGRFDRVVGYSLGTLLLLAAAGQVRPPVTLLAPIFAFSAEENLGGRVARAQLRQVARWLRRDPVAALVDFYARAGLDVPVDLASAGATHELEWGLTHLETQRVVPPLPAGWSAWCGADDPLLDAARLHALDPQIRVVAGVGHHPAALIAAFAAAHGGAPHRAA